MTVKESGRLEGVFARVLELAHDHLELDVAWISEFTGGGQLVHAVAGGATFTPEEGDLLDHPGSYCSRVVAGTLPSAIPDLRSDPRTRDLPVTQATGAGAYLGVPVRLPGGNVFGMLCSLSDRPTPIVERDVRFVAMLAELLAAELAAEAGVNDERGDRRARIVDALDAGQPRMVFQPIVRLHDMHVCGAEALARFDAEPRDPSLWFGEAAMVGLGTELELAAIGNALARLHELPEEAYVSLNVSPETVLDERLEAALAGTPGERILLEITEQAPIADYVPVVAALRRLRSRGVRLAVDDAGAGYASLNHILRLRPDVIKLDVALTRDVDSDPARQALAKALTDFARSIGASIVAEGVETQAELDMLSWLGVTCAQGYFLARPGDLPLPAIDAVPVGRRRAGKELRALRQDRDHEAFVRSVLTEVTELTGLESSYLTFYDGDCLEHRWVHNAGALKVPEPFTIPYEESLCHRSREAGLIWTAAVAADIPGSGLAEAAGIETFASVPVPGPQGTSGPMTLCALSREPRYIGADALARLEELAATIGARLSGA